MPDKYIGMGIVSAASGLLGAVAVLIGFKPRIERAEDDIQKLFSRLEAQERGIGEIKTGIATLLERREHQR